MKKKRHMKIYRLVLLALFSGIVFLSGCVNPLDEKGRKIDYDPNKPVKITSFSPDSGRVATQMLIYGENFGADLAKISVSIKDKKAAVIGVNNEGTIIYCIVPSLKGTEIVHGGDVDSGYVKVKVVDQEIVSQKELHYTYSENVSTFLGFTDQDGNTAIVDGDFSKAQFQSPFWLAFDEPTPEGTPRNFFLIEENNGLRFINMQEKKVETLFRTGNGVDRPRTIAFTNDNDTMIIANDANNWTDIGTIILVRNKLTRRFPNSWKTVMNHKQCNGGAIHPITNEYWFNSYDKSQVYKVKDRSTIPWKYGNATATNTNGSEGLNYFFLVQDNQWEFNIQIAPSGKFAYIVSKNKHYIARMEFNFATGNFEKPQPYVGMINKPGFLDGVGLNTQFREPQQGAFDAQDNFYVCDGENNCIRKVTPTGQVSTFAGRPEKAGYSDGALRDAQFDSPFGIIYDKNNQTFYIADRDNRRIRTIKVE
ncbi:MAG: IPT/TIG domain-containing protein [Paludibacteraceae bacterium]